MTIISYAQNFEDVMLWRALKHIEKGFYIDVGAWSPDVDSVTRLFYENAWCGINIEPNAEYYALLGEHRENDLNIRVALSDEPGTKEMNYFSNPGLSTLDSGIAEMHLSSGLENSREMVKIETLASIWRDNVSSGQEVHFLKVDVEGLEESVLRGNDWDKNRPWIAVVEATIPMSQEESYDVWENILLSAGYIFVYADGLNRFYVAKEHSELVSSFKYPPNVFDEFILSAQFQAEQKMQQAEERALLAEEEVKHTKNILENMTNSMSWRVTEPLRKVKKFIK